MTTEPIKTTAKNLLIDNRWLIITAFFSFIIYLLLPVLKPFLIAGNLTYIFDLIVDNLSLVSIGKFQLGYTLTSALVVMAGIFGIISSLLLTLIPLLQKNLYLSPITYLTSAIIFALMSNLGYYALLASDLELIFLESKLLFLKIGKLLVICLVRDLYNFVKEQAS